MKNLYLKRIRARKGAIWFKVLWIILCSLIYFWVAELISLIVYQYAEYGFSTRNTHRIYRFLLKVKESPEFVFEAYYLWLKALWNAKLNNWTRFIPLIVPVLFLVIVFMGYMRSPHSFNLWYRLHNRFANMQEVLKMRILGGGLMSLGRFEGKALGLNKIASLFGWGASELGKSSTVAIPSILESNQASIVAVDCKGELASFTSGHRAGLGRIFYFNWNLLDNPAEGEYWPRWNPLSDKDMPGKSEKRDLYLKRLAEHLLPEQEDSHWLKLSNRAVEGVLNFFVNKIEQACANDYLLSRLLENGRFDSEDKEILSSYYATMLKKYAEPAIENLKQNLTTVENYMPVGSWNGIPDVWQGKELCLAMITDCLIQKYFMIKQSADDDGWHIVLQEFLEESVLFGYSAKVIDVFKELLELERKKRNILFMSLLGPLSIFRKSNIRGRTSCSDFSLKYARGMKSNETGEWHVNTTYLIAAGKDSAFMTRLMTDMLIERNLEKHKSAYRNPILFVLDDMEQLPKFQSLQKGLLLGAKTNMSFLLLTDGLKKLHENYGRDGLEDIVSSCTYKLIFADNNIELSRQFREMAVFGAKSVQIPAIGTGTFAKVKQGIADSYYYRKIADDLISVRSNKKIDKGQHLLLVEGYYNLPVKVDARCFSRDVKYKTLSMKDICYYLDADLVMKRNVQDVDVPPLTAVLKEIGVDNLQDDEINIRLEDHFEEDVAVVETIDEPEEKEPVVKPASKKEKKAASGGKAKDGENWWMNDEAFAVKKKDGKENPFGE